MIPQALHPSRSNSYPQVAQAKAGRSNLPAIAAVVGFSNKTVLMEDVGRNLDDLA